VGTTNTSKSLPHDDAPLTARQRSHRNADVRIRYFHSRRDVLIRRSDSRSKSVSAGRDGLTLRHQYESSIRQQRTWMRPPRAAVTMSVSSIGRPQWRHLTMSSINHVAQVVGRITGSVACATSVGDRRNALRKRDSDRLASPRVAKSTLGCREAGDRDVRRNGKNTSGTCDGE